MSAIIVHQLVVCLAEDRRWEHFLPIAIVFKSARFAHQRADDVPVFNPGFPSSAEPFHVSYMLPGKIQLDPFSVQSRHHFISPEP